MRNAGVLFAILIFLLANESLHAQALSANIAANPPTIMWGEVSKCQGFGTGGAPSGTWPFYSFAFEAYCLGTNPPAPAYILPPSDRFTYRGENTGIYTARCTIQDTTGAMDDEFTQILVLDPTEIKFCDDSCVDIPISINGGNFVAARNFIFKPFRGSKKTGVHAVGFAQEKVWDFGTAEPGDDSCRPGLDPQTGQDIDGWIPDIADTTGTFQFIAGQIHDLKGVGGPVTLWNSHSDDDVLDTRLQIVRVKYTSCSGPKILKSGVYKVEFIKKNDTTATIKHTLQP